MAEITFRKMTESDLDRVVAMEKEIFSDPWDYNAFDSDLKNEHCWPVVAEQDGTIVGYSISLYCCRRASNREFWSGGVV